MPVQNVTLCLTATIEPNTILVSRSNALERLADYKKAIRFYLVETNMPIVFLENSGFDLSTDSDFLEFQKEQRFKLLRQDAHPETEKGKGFQEFFMLDNYVQNDLRTNFLVKVTGRYIIRNIMSLCALADSQINFDLHLRNKVAITGFFIVKRDLYLRYFTSIFQQVNDAEGTFIEHVVYDLICNSSLIDSCKLLPVNPQFEGHSGSYGASLQRNKYKMRLRGWERKINRRMGIPKFLIEY